MRKYLISSIVAISFIILIMSLGFGVRDDYFMWAFPSLPFVIGCFENCGALKVSIATISNGIIIGLILLGILSIIDKFREKK